MKLKYNIIFQEVGDTYIGVAVGGESGQNSFPGVLKFNETGYDIAHRLKEEISREELIAQLLQEYDIDEASLGGYVDDILNYLKNNNVI